MTQIGWAILGTGVIAQKFASALMQAKDAKGEPARLVSVLSREGATAARFAAACGVGKGAAEGEAKGAAKGAAEGEAKGAAKGAAKGSAAGIARGVMRLEDVLGDDAVDIVYIATPNHLHAVQAIACLKAGKAVLCEKPLATSGAEARAIAAAAAASGTFFMEALWTLCLPAITTARELVKAGRIGTLREVSGSLSFGRDYDPGSRFFSPDLGGGALLDLGVYPLALAISFLGKPEAVRGLMRPAPNGVDMQAEVIMRHEDAMAHISCGFHGEGANDMVLTGTSGIIRLQAPLNAPALISCTAKASRRDMTGGASPERIMADAASRTGAWKQMLRPLKPGRTTFHPAPYRGNGFIHQIEEAMACLKAGKRESDTVPLALSLAVQDVIDAVKAE